MKERVSYATAEGDKLDSRLSHALEQWQTGLSRTQATARQLQSLASQVSTVVEAFQCSVHKQCSGRVQVMLPGAAAHLSAGISKYRRTTGCVDAAAVVCMFVCFLSLVAAPPAAQLSAPSYSQGVALSWPCLQVGGIEKTAHKSLTELRYVSKKEAITLRSDIAQQLAVAQQQRRAIEKTLWGLTKKGL